MKNSSKFVLPRISVFSNFDANCHFFRFATQKTAQLNSVRRSGGRSRVVISSFRTFDKNRLGVIRASVVIDLLPQVEDVVRDAVLLRGEDDEEEEEEEEAEESERAGKGKQAAPAGGGGGCGIRM